MTQPSEHKSDALNLKDWEDMAILVSAANQRSIMVNSEGHHGNGGVGCD